jgi:chemotaxis protein CheX
MTPPFEERPLMNVDHARPFLLHTAQTLEVMAGVRPVEVDMSAMTLEQATYDVSAIIGITGTGTGAIVLSLPADLACKVTGTILNEKHDEVDQDVIDCAGELVNIISGNAKRDLVRFGFADLHMSLPHVVVGSHRSVWHSRDMPCLRTQFHLSEYGSFSVEVNLRPTSRGAADTGRQR